MNKYISRFNKETAPTGHNGTILAGNVLPEGMKAPFGHAWGYLEGKSMMEGHSHPTDEIYLVFGGKGFCHVGDERFAVKPGDVVEIPPDLFHTMECEEGETMLWAALWWDRIMTHAHLESVAKSYDRDIDSGGQGNYYDDLPGYITNDPDYSKWKKIVDNGASSSRIDEIKNWLSPDINMNFIHLGCSLNLMFKGYDKWPSTYHGVDISEKTVNLLNNFIADKNLSVGSLYCGSIHETPFADDCFDIGDCIGVLEYYEADFVEKAIKEAHRIMKPNGKLVLDIPNIASPICRIMMMVEEYKGRPDKFNMTRHEFEDIIKDYFEIEHTDKADSESAMTSFYYLVCKK